MKEYSQRSHVKKRRREYGKLYMRIYRKNNIIYKQKSNKRNRERGQELKLIVYNHYNNKCQCCGESVEDFLTIDHINNDGNQQRLKINSGLPFYKWIIKNNFPDDLRILCFNCNYGRKKNKGKLCPHRVRSN